MQATLRKLTADDGDHGLNRYADPAKTYPELLVGRMTTGH